ncbi:MAG: DUF4338 domain-containing protein [Anaerolineaceae bacterium]|nr:DUF4338 domain-containing protein [Anaerolineaceae bacterium]
MQKIKQQTFCGRKFTGEEISLIQEVVAVCGGISRLELAHTVCELLEWKRPNDRLKARECGDFLEILESKGALTLPKKKQRTKTVFQKIVPENPCKPPDSTLHGSVEEFTPLEVRQVQNREQRNLFKELIGRHHYLGYAMPFGARLQYLVYVNRPHREVVSCIQFSSPAWRMRARDEWIGWTDERRKTALQQVVNNSRFLVLAPIRNLASMILSCTLRELKSDWEQQYGLKPLLVETLVNRQQFNGGCYRASNWIELGETTGRGRMDRANKRHGAQVKTILVYPLVKNAVHQLREGDR